MPLSSEDKQKYIIEMTEELLAIPRKWNRNEDQKLTDMSDLVDVSMNAFISFGGAFMASFVTTFVEDKNRKEIVQDIMQRLLAIFGKNLQAQEEYIKNNPGEFKLQ